MILINIILLTIAISLFSMVLVSINKTISKEFKYHFNSLKFTTNNFNETIKINQDSFNKTGMPIIKIKIKNESFNLLIDSGANCNILNLKAFNLVDDNNYSKSHVSNFITASGESENEGFKVNIEFKQKQRKFNEDFEIRDMSQAFDQIKLKDKVQIDGILGAPFFNKYNWTLDFENLVIWIK